MEKCDLNEVPLTAIGFKARDLLCRQLDKVKVLPSSNGIPRDFRGLAQLSGVSSNDIRNPTNGVLVQWCRSESKPSFQDLLDNLSHLDRWDIIHDVEPFLEVDALNYKLKQRQVAFEYQRNQVPHSSSDNDIITYDDADLVRIGLPPGHRYDAYLLYADQDDDIAKEVVSKLENDYNLKLCVKDRDIIPGAGFEHEAITYLISERCNWLIVIITPNFIDCPAQKFIYNYSVALALSERRKKIVPCIFRVCNDAAIKQKLYKITYSTFAVDFTRRNLFKSQWEKLSETVAAPRLPSISYSSKAIEPAPSKNFIQDQNSLKDSPIIEMSKIPDRPPRSKDNPSKISTLKFKGSLEVVDGSCDTMKQSCSSSDPAAVTSTPQQSKKSQSSISDLMSGLKINKIAQRCKNIIPKRKKSKKLEEAT